MIAFDFLLWEREVREREREREKEREWERMIDKEERFRVQGKERVNKWVRCVKVRKKKREWDQMRERERNECERVREGGDLLKGSSKVFLCKQIWCSSPGKCICSEDEEDISTSHCKNQFKLILDHSWQIVPCVKFINILWAAFVPIDLWWSYWLTA